MPTLKNKIPTLRLYDIQYIEADGYTKYRAATTRTQAIKDAHESASN